jgi:hypothetical protein
MAIKITRPFEYESKEPNFERDRIDARQYSNNNPMRLTAEERAAEAAKYDIGHVVYDGYTDRHYIWLGQDDGWGFPTVNTLKVKFADVNAETETLRLDNIERKLAIGIGNAVYAPVNGMPSDWNENWSEYYVFNSSTKKYVANQSQEYSSSTQYYVMVFRNDGI